MEKVRTRFAPSPTGFLHVGGVRTALFAWLLAKKAGGSFLLRVEDTDQQRLVPGAIRAIIEDLRWLGIEPDEGPSAEDLVKVDPSLADMPGIGGPKGPYIQSLRRDRYKEVAEELVKLGVAYYSESAADTSWIERKGKVGGTALASAKEGAAIRLRLPRDQSISIEDGIRGKISWESLSLNDPVLLKSDGFPTYHLAVVVDDHDMEISHVIRGEEWIPSTPIHVLLYKALGWEMPIFAHPASVLGEDGKKLSKRHGATSVSAFKDGGYIPEALFNFLVLIGWAPGSGVEQEIFSKKELIELFSLDHVHSSAGVFAYNKLNWMNATYLRAMDNKELANRLIPYLTSAGLKVESDEERKTLEFITPHIKERVELLNQAAPLLEFLFKKPLERELKQMLSKQITKPDLVRILDNAANKLQNLADFSGEAIDSALKAISTELGFPVGGVFIAIRVAVTGKKGTPPLTESLLAVGKEETIRRIIEAKDLVERSDL